MNLPYYFNKAFYQEQFLATALVALALAFNAVDWHGKPHTKFSPLDLGLGTLSLGAALWTAAGWDYLLQDFVPTPEVLILSGIILVLVLEALRRCTGWGLLSVVVAFFI